MRISPNFFFFLNILSFFSHATVNCLCVCNQGPYADNITDAGDRLLITLGYLLTAKALTPNSNRPSSLFEWKLPVKGWPFSQQVDIKESTHTGIYRCDRWRGCWAIPLSFIPVTQILWKNLISANILIYFLAFLPSVIVCVTACPAAAVGVKTALHVYCIHFSQ